MTTGPEKQVEKGQFARYREAWAKLNVTQGARVKLKQGHEQCSALAVFVDWPSLFDPERVQDGDELKECCGLIYRRPGLFPEATNV
jgi:hypothetical protein